MTFVACILHQVLRNEHLEEEEASCIFPHANPHGEKYCSHLVDAFSSLS